MVNHGLSTGALFLLVGMLYERAHTRRIADFGGLAQPLPVFAAAFLLVALSSLGLPGLNGFVGEFLILAGTFVARRPLAIAGAFGIVLAAVYLLWSYERVFHGPLRIPHAERRHVWRDPSMREIAVLAPVLAAILWLGVYPKPVLDRIEPSVERVLQRVDGADTKVASR